uniref:Uncharacterized protein n=1 Tax=Candidatus Kentrum sp. LFY TaxID=2126342 RepID=A0A450X0E4_9GAMM|nr:MAG: hypothetical protein BECKLFY1418C_GA0070996_11268 [Candidatus Kentron sp. LFY]
MSFPGLFISRSSSQMRQVLQDVGFARLMPNRCFIGSKRSFASCSNDTYCLGGVLGDDGDSIDDDKAANRSLFVSPRCFVEMDRVRGDSYKPRYFLMCLASLSSISECLGTGCFLPLFGFNN